MTREQEVFVLAERTLDGVIAQITDSQWEQPKPEWFAVGRQADPTLANIVCYHAYDTAWVPDVLAGKLMSAVGSTWEHVKTDFPVDYHGYSEAAIAAVETLDDPEKQVYLSYGEFAAREYLRHTISFRGFRAYDIAKWIGVDTALPDDLVQGMWELISPDVEAWRAMGVYGPAVRVADDAPLQDRLLAMSGRDYQ